MTKETSGQYVTVPVEPTEEMLEAGQRAMLMFVEPHEAATENGFPIEVSLGAVEAEEINADLRGDIAKCFRAMLVAAPHTDAQAAIKELEAEVERLRQPRSDTDYEYIAFDLANKLETAEAKLRAVGGLPGRVNERLNNASLHLDGRFEGGAMVPTDDAKHGQFVPLGTAKKIMRDELEAALK